MTQFDPLLSHQLFKLLTSLGGLGPVWRIGFYTPRESQNPGVPRSTVVARGGPSEALEVELVGVWRVEIPARRAFL